MNHTPTPWKQRPIKLDGYTAYADIGTDTHLAATAYGNTEEKALANAAFIVQACNSHEALINALELADAWMGNGQLCITPANVVQEKIQAALKLEKPL